MSEGVSYPDAGSAHAILRSPKGLAEIRKRVGSDQNYLVNAVAGCPLTPFGGRLGGGA